MTVLSANPYGLQTVDFQCEFRFQHKFSFVEPFATRVFYSALSDRGFRSSDITHVVCSHGHSDHVGNLNLFPDALLVVGFDIVRGDLYYAHELAKVSVRCIINFA